MPGNHPIIKHTFGGGWATSFGRTTEVELQGNVLTFPYLIDADNITFTLDGGFRKIGGTDKLHTSALESGVPVRGLFDYWRHGTAGAPAQRRLIYVGTKIKADAGEASAATFADIKTGLNADKIVNFTSYNDIAIIALTGSDVPMKYISSGSAATLGTRTPNFAFSETHKNRLWAAGVDATPSRLFYSQVVDAGGADGDWDGLGAGFIDIDPGDGDKITAIASHKNDLFIFKGPYKGSIHRISGSSPTGSDGFARLTFVDGLGAVGQNTIFRFKDDLGFVWSDGSIHSLAATDAYGDFSEASLSRPIDSWIKEHGNQTQLPQAWAANSVLDGGVLIVMATDTQTTNNTALYMDYRFDPVRWSKFTAFQPVCVASSIDSGRANRPRLMAGWDDGFVRKLDSADRSIDGTTAMIGRARTPYVNYGSPMQMKTLQAVSVGIAPRGAYNMSFQWERDDRPVQAANISQAGGDVLGPASANVFTLGTSTLGGAQFVERFAELSEGGEFHGISYQFAQGGNFHDFEVHSFAARVKPGAIATEA